MPPRFAGFSADVRRALVALYFCPLWWSVKSALKCSNFFQYYILLLCKVIKLLLLCGAIYDTKIIWSLWIKFELMGILHNSRLPVFHICRHVSNIPLSNSSLDTYRLWHKPAHNPYKSIKIHVYIRILFLLALEQLFYSRQNCNHNHNLLRKLNWKMSIKIKWKIGWCGEYTVNRRRHFHSTKDYERTKDLGLR